MQKVFALVDCNSFYCSCERVFRPDLKHKPVIVLSNNDGCAIARTSEAKALGIKMGAPYFKIKELCQKYGVAVFSSNFALYTNLSDRVMNTLVQLCPKVEVYSVDEAFCDLSGIKNLSEFGFTIKNTIAKNIGIPTGVGIGPTKVLAKLANHVAKKSARSQGVVNLMNEEFRKMVLQKVPVEEIWGVGRASSEKLQRLGLKTAYDFAYYNNEEHIQKVFTKVGVQIKHELLGINCFTLEQDVEAKKEIMCSRTFGGSVIDLAALKESIANYISNAAEKMRAQDSLCTQVSIFARTNPFKQTEQFYLYDRAKLMHPTCDTRKLIHIAFELLEKNFRYGYEYKKAGVKLSGFYNTQEYQLDLLSAGDSLEDFRLMEVIDRINAREGEGVVKLMACGVDDKAWRMNRAHKSPRYLTSWEDLAEFF